MTSTPNKNYALQSTGSNVNTWGVVANSIFSLIDSNLGGTLSLSVAGASNVTLSASQASNLIYNFTGALTGNINVIFPAAGGLYFINNETSGAFTLTIQAGTSVTGLMIPQGQKVPIYVDNSTTPPVVGGFTGTQYVYAATSITNPVSANALVVVATSPSNFTLNNGTFMLFTPSEFNTGSSTLKTPDGSIITLQKPGFAGLVNLISGDLDPEVPVLAQYNGSVWICLFPLTGYEATVSANQSVGLANGYTPYNVTAACTFTIAQSTTLINWWYVDIFALGGAVTLAINVSDSLNQGVAGVGLIMPQGTSGRLTTDANGNLFLNGTAVYTSPTATTPTVQKFTSGTGTYTRPAGVTLLRARMIAGGGGTGNGSGQTNGANTSFGGWTAIGGALGSNNTSAGGIGGTGGSNGTGTLINRQPGDQGGGGNGGSNLGNIGGMGPLGGAGKTSANNSATPSGGQTNTGAGAAGVITSPGVTAAAGSGEYVEFYIPNPSSTYSYTVGVGGSAGTSGATGGSGVIIIEEFYNPI